MDGQSVVQQLHYAFTGSAFIFMEDCDFTWTIGATDQRDLDQKHVAKLADMFAVQGVHWMPGHCHVSVTINKSTLSQYLNQHSDIVLRIDPPPVSAVTDYYSQLSSFSQSTGSKFEVQAAMHRLHAAALLAKKQSEENPGTPVVPVRFVADIYDPGNLFPVIIFYAANCL